MRICLGAMAFAALVAPCSAQDGARLPSVTPEQRESVGEKRAEETRELFRRAKLRQGQIDRKNNALWTRWIFAVCVQCSITPKNVRIVYTNPIRVLAGIPAAMDDARRLRRGQSI
ncbi:hypothetical protein [Methylobacterium trifolii]|uniref:Uncharacterized protein n=1 Tax=Methylobacterium trifolii TaxID=1003092 RepID=A0ABQ4U3Z8_9HYPH|nr:hypothetical protein [Methylobacterium trifolii]GJE61594.1 hypothetical protein MPOCJGCO_3716 [Methylobacterium trifolii]